MPAAPGDFSPSSSAVFPIAVLGSGAWGSAFGGAIAAENCPVVFWSRHHAAALSAAARPHCRAAASLQDALNGAAVIIVAVSSIAFADLLRQVGRLLGRENGQAAAAQDAAQAAAQTAPPPLFWLTKGFEPHSGAPLYQAARQLLPPQTCSGAISGPSFASEVARRMPAALALAAAESQRGAAETVRQRLHRPHLRLYYESDLIGVCVCGALKNMVAIAAGISDGLGMGENARAALTARALSEISALIAALGGRPETLLGLAGIGDLMLTCTSDLSRNRRLGLRLAAGKEGGGAGGKAGEEGDKAGGDTCEGRNTAATVLAQAKAAGLEVPILSAVGAVLAGNASPKDAVAQLLSRPPRG